MLVACGLVLSALPLGTALGLVPMPARYFAFVALATAAYLAAVELVKRRVVGRSPEAQGGQGRDHAGIPEVGPGSRVQPAAVPRHVARQRDQ